MTRNLTPNLTRLSVNLNKVALLRNSRTLGIPSVVRAGVIALEAGARGLTVHPRPDERHIRPHDVVDLATLLRGPEGTRDAYAANRRARTAAGLPPSTTERFAYAALVAVGDTEEEGMRLGEKLLWFLNTSLKSAPQFGKFLAGAAPPEAAPMIYRTRPKADAKPLPNVKPSVGKNKAEALKLQLSNFWGVKAEAFGVRVEETNVATLCATADLVIDAFDNAKSRRTLSTWARSADKPLVHAAVSADGTFGLVRWDERFVADEEGAPGQATCEGGEHLPLIALVSSTLARTIQDFVAKGTKRDAMIALSGVNVTAES